MGNPNVLSFLNTFQKRIIEKLDESLIWHQFLLEKLDNNGKFRIIDSSSKIIDYRALKKFLGIMYIVFKDVLEEIKNYNLQDIDLLSIIDIKVKNSQNYDLIISLEISLMQIVIECPSSLLEELYREFNIEIKVIQDLRIFEKYARDFEKDLKEVEEEIRKTIDRYIRIANYIYDSGNELLEELILLRFYLNLRFYLEKIDKLSEIFSKELEFLLIYDGEIKIKKLNFTENTEEIVKTFKSIPLAKKLFSNFNDEFGIYEVEIKTFLEKNDEIIINFLTKIIDDEEFDRNRIISKLTSMLEKLEILKQFANNINRLGDFIRSYQTEIQYNLAFIIFLEEFANCKDCLMKAFKLIGYNSEEIKKLITTINFIEENKENIASIKEIFKNIGNDLVKWDKLLYSNANSEAIKNYAVLVKEIKNYIERDIELLTKLIAKISNVTIS